jgi:hypothetical protein
MLNSRFLFLQHHLGLGDHLLCNGLYRHLAKQHGRIYVVAKTHNSEALKKMLCDVPNIKILSVESSRADPVQKRLGGVARRLNLPTLGIGFYGKDFFLPEEAIRFDEQFYRQAGVPFEERWASFQFCRDEKRERDLMGSFGFAPKEYIFIHEDTSRGFLIDRSRITSRLPVVEARKGPGVGFFDYARIIENAAEVHCIESSFAALIEGMGLSMPKRAHRYARPEAFNDFRHEFTYKSDWEILI